jgi:hypothetical protein
MEPIVILTPDSRNELMLNYVTREKYLRPLSNEEIFNVLSDKYDGNDQEQASILLDKLMDYGLSLEEVFQYSINRGD